jgi:uncharacterized membrane protein
MVWWWIGNAVLLLVVIPLVVHLANGLVRRTQEVRDYASDILAHGLGITANLDPVPALADTAGLVRVTRDAAARYAAAVEVLLGRSR